MCTSQHVRTNTPRKPLHVPHIPPERSLSILRLPATLPPGDYTPDLRALLAADIIICTPEKWDGISRAWQTRGYVKKVRPNWVCGCRCGRGYG